MLLFFLILMISSPLKQQLSDEKHLASGESPKGGGIETIKEKCLVTSIRVLSGHHDLLVNTRHMRLGVTEDAEVCSQLCCDNYKCRSALLQDGMCHGLPCNESECKSLLTFTSFPHSSSDRAQGRFISMKKINKTIEENQLEEVQKLKIVETNIQHQKRSDIPELPPMIDQNVRKVLSNHSSCDRIISHSLNKVFKEKMLLVDSIKLLPSDDGYNKCMRICCGRNDCKAAFLSNSSDCLLFGCKPGITCEINPVACDGHCDALLMVFEEKNSKRFRIPFRDNEQYVVVVLNATHFPYHEDLAKTNTVLFFLTSIAIEDAITSVLERIPIFRGVQTLQFIGNEQHEETLIILRVCYTPTANRMQLFRSILDLIRKEQVVFSSKTAGLIPSKPKGFLLSQTGFSLREENGTSLVCPYDTCLGVSWPVVLTGARAHISCPRKAQGLAERYCTSKAVTPKWEVPSFRHCSQKKYRQLLSEIKEGGSSVLTIVIDKLLQFISMDMDLQQRLIDGRERRLSKRSLDDTSTDTFHRSMNIRPNDTPSQIFSDLGDIHGDNLSSDEALMAIMEPQPIVTLDDNEHENRKFKIYGASNAGNGSVAQLYVGPMIKESLNIHTVTETPIASQKADMILHQMKQVRLRSNLHTSPQVFGRTKENIDIWRHGMFGADIITSVEIMDQLVNSKFHANAHPNIVEIKELLTISSLVLDVANSHEWKILNEDQETFKVFLKLLRCLEQLTLAILDEETYMNMDFFVTQSIKIKAGTTEVFPYAKNSPMVYKLTDEISFSLNPNVSSDNDPGLSISKRWAVVDLITIDELFPSIDVFSTKSQGYWKRNKIFRRSLIFQRGRENPLQSFTITIRSLIQPRSCFVLDISPSAKDEMIKSFCTILVVSEYTINCTCNSSGFIVFGYQTDISHSNKGLNKQAISGQSNIFYWCWFSAIALLFILLLVVLIIIIRLCYKQRKVVKAFGDSGFSPSRMTQYTPPGDGNVYVDLFKNVEINENRNAVGMNDLKDPSFSSTSNLLSQFSDRSSLTNVKLNAETEPIHPDPLNRRESSISVQNVQWDSFYSGRSPKSGSKSSNLHPRDKRKTALLRRYNSFPPRQREPQARADTQPFISPQI